jgi:hypothetical protein
VREVGARLRLVWTVTRRGDRTYRTRVGVAWDNADGSLSARLDAVPVSGEIVVGDWVDSTDARSGRRLERDPADQTAAAGVSRDGAAQCGGWTPEAAGGGR